MPRLLRFGWPVLSDEARWLCGVIALCAGVKGLLLLVDHRARLFLGDSATYLWSAINLTVPADRSFTYPLLVRSTAIAWESLDALLCVQTLCGVVTSACMAMLLRRAFGVSRVFATLSAVAIALDPAQLFYERMVMTESPSTCVVVMSLGAAFAHLRDGRFRWLFACCLLGVLSASLRVGLVPLAVMLAPTPAFLRAVRVRERDASRHVALAIVLTATAHIGYQHAYGFMTDGHATYIRDGGLYRLGLVAPLLTSADFADTGVSAAMLNDVSVPLRDARLREAQIWQRGGLIDVLKRSAGDRAYRVAARLSSHAIAADPCGLVRLGAQTTLDYFDERIRRDRMASDIGADRQPDEKTATLLRERFSYTADAPGETLTPMPNYFASSWPWLLACLLTLAPLSMIAALTSRRRAPLASTLLALLGVGLVGGHILCSHIVSFRYLHPFPVLEIGCIAIVIDAWVKRMMPVASTPPRCAAAVEPA